MPAGPGQIIGELENATTGGPYIADVTAENRLQVDVKITSPLESNGAIPVNIQDQTSTAIDTYFLQQTGSFTLAADTSKSSTTSLVYTFTATTGHGLTTGNEILLLDVIGDVSFYSLVKNVVGDTITIDRPIDHVFPSATTLCRITTSQMAVDGGVTPQIFTARAGTNPVDFVRFLITMLDDSSMDDGKFGGIAALTNGLVFRIVNGTQKTIFNFKSNQEIRQFCYDVAYADKAPAGQFGLSSRITFGGQGKHGVVLRVSGSDALQWIVQDDLTDLLSLRISAEGHEVTD